MDEQQPRQFLLFSLLEKRDGHDKVLCRVPEIEKFFFPFLIFDTSCYSPIKLSDWPLSYVSRINNLILGLSIKLIVEIVQMVFFEVFGVLFLGFQELLMNVAIQELNLVFRKVDKL